MKIKKFKVSPTNTNTNINTNINTDVEYGTNTQDGSNRKLSIKNKNKR